MKTILVFILLIQIPFILGFFPKGLLPNVTDDELGDWPEDQPGCLFRPAMPYFYAYHSNIDQTTGNWLCDEPLHEKLKICIELYQKITQGIINSTYQIIKDKESVTSECERRKMIFELLNQTESGTMITEDSKNLTLEVNMFKCPITKMDLEFPVEWAKPEIYDVYISLGRNELTIAVLTDSLHINNICVRDVYLYAPPNLRDYNMRNPRQRPRWPKVIRNYIMKDEDIERLAERLATRTRSTRSTRATIPHGMTLQNKDLQMSSKTSQTVHTTQPMTSHTTIFNEIYTKNNISKDNFHESDF